MSIKDNIEIINNRILNAENRSGIKNGTVKLMAVSKFHPVEEIEEAVNAGHFLFGENRVQEANEKFPLIFQNNSSVSLHMIGQLQSNKVKTAVQIAECIQSVDRLSLVEEIEKQCAKINKTIKILFEIHTGEESKSGFQNEEELIKVLDLFKNNSYPHVVPAGFMTMAPFTDDEKLIRKSFSYLRNLKEKLQIEYKEFSLNELSMGMSGDFEIAIEEGSTLVRVGTAIFGERNYNK